MGKREKGLLLGGLALGLVGIALVWLGSRPTEGRAVAPAEAPVEATAPAIPKTERASRGQRVQLAAAGAEAPLDEESDEPKAGKTQDDRLRLTVHVVDAAGKSLTEAQVLLYERSGSQVFQATDERGRAVFRDPAPELPATVLVWVANRGYAQVAHRVEMEAGTLDQKFRVVLREPSRHLAGRVLDELGQPLEDALVQIRGDRTIQGLRGDPIPVEGVFEATTIQYTNTEGKFRFPMLYEGQFELTASHPTHELWSTTLSAIPNEDDLLLVFTAADLAWLELELTHADTGAPITYARIAILEEGTSATSGEPRQAYHTLRQADGRYRLAAPAGVPLELRIDGGSPASHANATDTRSNLVLQPGPNTLAVALRRARYFDIELLDATGRPIEDARLSFRHPDGSPVFFATRKPWRYQTDYTSHYTGPIKLEKLPATPLTLVIHHEEREHELAIDLTYEQTEPFLVRLPEGPQAN